MRLPWVKSNQRIVPRDFWRLTDAVEDVIGQLAAHALIDPTDEALRQYGVVLWGLQVTDVSDIGGPKVRVAPGAALMPATAARSTRIPGENCEPRGWRLAVLVDGTTLALAPPGAGQRTDTIELRALEDLTDEELREFRVVGAGGIEQVAVNQTETVRATGVLPAVLQAVDVVAPGVTAGSVRLAAVTLNVGGIAAGGLVDWRAVLFGAVTGAAGAAEGGVYFRSLRRAWVWIRAAHLALKARVDVVLDVNGSLNASVPVTPDASGGPLVFAGALLSVGSRVLRAGTGMRTPRIRVGDPDVATDQTPELAIADAYENEANGLALNAGTVVRGCVLVHPHHVGVVFDHAEWLGQNVTSVARTEPGRYVVTFDAAAFGETFGGVGEWRWVFTAHPCAIETPGAAILENAAICNTFVNEDNPASLVVWVLGWIAGNMVGIDRSFTASLHGPLGAALYNDNPAENLPGGSGAGWNVVSVP